MVNEQGKWLWGSQDERSEVRGTKVDVPGQGSESPGPRVMEAVDATMRSQKSGIGGFRVMGS